MKQFWIWLAILIVLLAAWLGASWYLGERSAEELNRAVAAHREKGDFSLFDLEIEQATSTPFSAELSARLILPALTGTEPLLLTLKRHNGPVVYRDGYGLQLAAARWHITPAVQNDEVDDASAVLPTNALQDLDWSASVQQSLLNDLVIEADWARSPEMQSGQIADSAELKAAYVHDKQQLTADVLVRQLRLTDPDGVDLSSESFVLTAQYPSLTRASDRPDSLRLSIDAPDALLRLARGQPQQKIAVTGNGLIWSKDDTLSSDLELIADVRAEQPLRWLLSAKASDLRFAALPEYLQARAMLAELQQQSQWALEEVETPEQQDFFHGLSSDMRRLRANQLTTFLQALLLPAKSRLNTHLSVQKAGEAVAVIDTNLAAARTQLAPPIPVVGELTILRLQSNVRWDSLLKRWHRRRWLRAYDDSYEAEFQLKPDGLIIGGAKPRMELVRDELLASLLDQ